MSEPEEFDYSHNYIYNDNSAYAIPGAEEQYQSSSFAVEQPEEPSQQPANATLDNYKDTPDAAESEFYAQIGDRTSIPAAFAPTTQYQSAAIAPIGPDFSSAARKSDAEKTSSSLNSVPYPDGYTAKNRQREYSNKRIISDTVAPYYPQPKNRGKMNKKMALRAAGGEVWEDKSMMMWNESIDD